MTDARRTMNEANGGEWLREARKRAGYAVQSDFARAAGLDQTLLSNYETGKTRPSDQTAKRIADALRLSEVDVRRHFGLWVPDDNRPQPEELEESLLDRAMKLEELARSLLFELQQEKEKDEDRQKRQKRRPAS